MSRRSSASPGTTPAVCPRAFATYFVIEFDRPFTAHGVWTPAKEVLQKHELEGEHVGAYLQFDASDNKVVTFRAASSFISP